MVAIASPAPFTMQPMLPSSFTKERSFSPGLDFSLLLRVQIAHLLYLGVPGQAGIVYVYLGVHRPDFSFGCGNQRVYLGQRAIVFRESPIELQDDRAGLIGDLPVGIKEIS
jgi:hypothetical protein